MWLRAKSNVESSDIIWKGMISSHIISDYIGWTSTPLASR
jgi:hypothetical protein